ncbi:GNAT family N-acetyltransferase [Deinococcus marmoris]|uniref:GNAT family N-acetyltransferase n=1 Tax=Deinococcus marmoris TaxID=249408 RepID=UPI0004985EBD|nr:GNAT family protein [Deinococcus marmoris]
MPDLTLRERRPDDLAVEWRWSHAEVDPEWKLWDGPYFHTQHKTQSLTLAEFMERAAHKPPSSNRKIIALDDVCIGLVTRSEEAPEGGGWWELGIVIYDPAYWGGGLGTRALTLWTATTFAETDAHVITLTTWGGNERMVRAAERAGYRECARIPEARAWNGRRWDSVKLASLHPESH